MTITEVTKTYKRAIPAPSLAKVPASRSLGVKVFGYLLIPALVTSTVLGFALFNSRRESNIKKLLHLAQQGAIQVALEGKKVEAEAVRKAYEEAADIQDLSDLSATVALVDIKKSERQFLYARSDGANALASFKEDSRLAAAIEELSKKNVTQTLSRGGSQWVYVPLGDTGWAVVAEAPESAIGGGARQTILLALGLLVGAAGLTAAVFTLDFRSRLQVLLDACSKLEKGVTVPLSSGDEDELGQLQLAVARALQSISLREEELKEQIADVIRQEERQKLREDQEREAEYLESEIGGLLDVVSALEDGDLTVQAEVSDRATGLVADTLNRLRERLAEVIAGVLAVAQKVADGANELQQVARTVSENVENQAQSVVQGRALTEQVAELAKNAAEMVRESSQALATIQATVEQGQGAIQSLTEAIGVLQEGTVKIIQRMKTLGEFVGLAEQFVHDQGQIASLTQVLAINATLVAARAAEQRDPKQFIGVAREFEAIAGQVNTLATQTNDGLGVLQQRTAQIQSVVSAIDAEVQGLGRLVEGFTKGVDKSQKAFNDVQTVTLEVVATGHKVSQSSNEIVAAAESTARYISEIATLAEQTAQLTADARVQAENMGELAQKLLEGIRYFRLPVGLLPEGN